MDSFCPLPPDFATQARYPAGCRVLSVLSSSVGESGGNEKELTTTMGTVLQVGFSFGELCYRVSLLTNNATKQLFRESDLLFAPRTTVWLVSSDSSSRRKGVIWASQSKHENISSSAEYTVRLSPAGATSTSMFTRVDPRQLVYRPRESTTSLCIKTDKNNDKENCLNRRQSTKLVPSSSSSSSSAILMDKPAAKVSPRENTTDISDICTTIKLEEIVPVNVPQKQHVISKSSTKSNPRRASLDDDDSLISDGQIEEIEIEDDNVASVNTDDKVSENDDLVGRWIPPAMADDCQCFPGAQKEQTVSTQRNASKGNIHSKGSIFERKEDDKSTNNMQTSNHSKHNIESSTTLASSLKPARPTEMTLHQMLSSTIPRKQRRVEPAPIGSSNNPDPAAIQKATNNNKVGHLVVNPQPNPFSQIIRFGSHRYKEAMRRLKPKSGGPIAGIPAYFCCKFHLGGKCDSHCRRSHEALTPQEVMSVERAMAPMMSPHGPIFTRCQPSLMNDSIVRNRQPNPFRFIQRSDGHCMRGIAECLERQEQRGEVSLTRVCLFYHLRGRCRVGLQCAYAHTHRDLTPTEAEQLESKLQPWTDPVGRLTKRSLKNEVGVKEHKTSWEHPTKSDQKRSGSKDFSPAKALAKKRRISWGAPTLCD